MKGVRPDLFRGEMHEKNNASYCNYGCGDHQHTGSRGKASTTSTMPRPNSWVRSEAWVGRVAKVQWQTGELGKVDAGAGGNAVATYDSRRSMSPDVGVPGSSSMHAPFEVRLPAEMSTRHSRAFRRIPQIKVSPKPGQAATYGRV
ncbi:hypothetical protein RBH76_14135 [Oscillospiraceae bacterium MB24-C1]|nr:hypothetical protein RBH76_14135 [Oscillospiraceae bacterium MB24-C1]